MVTLKVFVWMWWFGWLLAFGSVGSAVAQDTGDASRPTGRDWPPVIGAWFWSQETLEAGGYRPFLDKVAERSPYTLLSTSCRRKEIVDPLLHTSMDQAVRYARSRGLKIALELDIRLARQAFRSRYPEELQEELVLRTIEFTADGSPGEVVFQGSDTTDHMIGSLPKYECLKTRLVRIYSFRKGEKGLDPKTLREITKEGILPADEGPRRLTVRVPAQSGRAVCVIAAHTLLTPDVFAPHLLAYQREILRQYADVPLAGIMKDEWGFPPDHTGNPDHDRYWYSRAMAAKYAEVSNGGDLVRDALLMYAGEQGRERDRQAAINRYRKLCRLRNVEIENEFYRAGKELFGPDAYIVTHPTWVPYPGAQEFRKNGLSWWEATRDMGQTDESTPYPCRTSLSKRWGFPLWYNQYYAKETDSYLEEMWAGALAGGRLNVHPLYPRPDLKGEEASLRLLQSGLMAGMTRLRLLDFITRAPLECPVAVVFGHTCAMNWTQPTYNSVGLEIASALCAEGYPTDLIPSSLIAAQALKIDSDGYICLGPQRYRAVVLYQPEYGDRQELAFFRRAAKGRSRLFLVGRWTMDYEARPLDTRNLLQSNVLTGLEEDACLGAVTRWLEDQGVARVTQWSPDTARWGHAGGKLATPPREGYSFLTDGTYLRIAGAKNPSGDPIRETFTWQGHSLTVDAVGLVAVRFAVDGRIAAFAAGGLRHLRTDRMEIALPEPADLAFCLQKDGRMQGLLQGWQGSLPESLRAITGEWQRLK